MESNEEKSVELTISDLKKKIKHLEEAIRDSERARLKAQADAQAIRAVHEVLLEMLVQGLKQ